MTSLATEETYDQSQQVDAGRDLMKYSNSCGCSSVYHKAPGNKKCVDNICGICAGHRLWFTIVPFTTCGAGGWPWVLK